MTRQLELPETVSQKSRTFMQEAWLRFRKHPLARVGGIVLLMLYLGAIFADFLAPYPEAKSFRDFAFGKPSTIHWRTSEGRFSRPFVCPSVRTRDPETFKVVVTENCSTTYPIRFFVQGEPYKFLGFIPANLRLMGGDWLVNDQARLFLWGTDDFGRDLWGRIWFGGRVSLTVGIFATALALMIGVTLGGLAGQFAGRPVTLSYGLLTPAFRNFLNANSSSGLLKTIGWTVIYLLLGWLLFETLSGFWQSSRNPESWFQGLMNTILMLGLAAGLIGVVYFLFFSTVRLDLDTLVMRTTEVLAAIPDLFLLITLSVIIPTGVPPSVRFIMVICILSFVNWGGLARTVRSQVLQLREMDYAQAATALGATDGRVLGRHILPGTFTFLIVVVTLSIPAFIIGESGLSFLGLGIQEPASSWGLLLSKAQAQGITSFTDRPWLLIPGLFILIAVLSYNLLGDGLRDAFDPRSKR